MIKDTQDIARQIVASFHLSIGAAREASRVTDDRLAGVDSSGYKAGYAHGYNTGFECAMRAAISMVASGFDVPAMEDHDNED